jgi:hypothetical protein
MKIPGLVSPFLQILYKFELESQYKLQEDIAVDVSLMLPCKVAVSK